MKKLFLILICLFFLTGCYNYKELDELGVVSSILIDIKDDKYKVKLEIYDEEEVQIFDGEGENITEAFKSAEAKSDNKFFYRHLNAVLVTDNVNIEHIIYYFFRNPETNDNFSLINTNDEEIYNDEEFNVGLAIRNDLGYGQDFSFFSDAKNFINKTSDLTLPIYKDNKLDGIKTLSNQNFKSEIKDAEENVLKILLENNNALLNTKCGNDYFILEINSVDTKIKVDNKIKIKINIKSGIQEFTCSEDITKIDDLKKLEKLASKSLEEDAKKLIDKLNNDSTDILGINTLIMNKYHKLDKYFNDYDYEIEADVSIYKKGLLLK